MNLFTVPFRVFAECVAAAIIANTEAMILKGYTMSIGPIDCDCELDKAFAEEEIENNIFIFKVIADCNTERAISGDKLRLKSSSPNSRYDRLLHVVF